MNVKIVSNSKHPLPNYETEYSAGMDLRASIDEPVVIEPFKRVIIPTGLFVELPVGYEGQVRPRSGLALKHGITVLNSPGTIDADYRGEIKVILVNLSDQPFVVNDGERIAQLVVSSHSRVSWIETDQLTSSDRGVGGFGSTGK